jgi:hypothetical protein
MNVEVLLTLKSSVLFLTFTLIVEASFILKPGYIATTKIIASKIRYNHQNINLLPAFYCLRDGRVIRNTKKTSFQKKQEFKVLATNDDESQVTQKNVENGKSEFVCDYFNVPMRMKTSCLFLTSFCIIPLS